MSEIPRKSGNSNVQESGSSSLWVHPDLSSCLSLTTLVRFIILATNLKDDIILVLQSAAAPISEPPAVLSPAFNAFLAAACSISPTQDIIWNGAIDMDVSASWTNDAQQKGFAEHPLYPPSHYYTQLGCRHGKQTLKKVKQREVILIILAHGPCAAKAVQLYCQVCEVGYWHNYTSNHPSHGSCIHGKSVVELFKTAMDVSWTSAANCAQLYNICLLQGKCAPEGYCVKFEITGDHVWDAFIITALLKDCKHRMTSLKVPHTGDQWDQFMKAMADQNHCLLLYGYEDVWHHYCDRFQLQECLAHARVAHPNDAVGQDVEISMLHTPEAEEEYEFNDAETLALPVLDSGGPTPIVGIGTTGALMG
ncbi:hypothetical protein BDR05DRAFT_953188 [Suillus weaverae]|nr:hypothetical protein BDR05DRAFT_953188 [Suillus weaverae]